MCVSCETGQSYNTQGSQLSKIVDGLAAPRAYIALPSTMKCSQLGKIFQINTNLTSSCLVYSAMGLAFIFCWATKNDGNGL